ncbi:MAG: hypothetical protein D6731_08270 [Planctomycetota bacterium]|nr:MAG: hypothetical protein D6731_08270 [Planctomycetota bacterium]
MEAPWRAWAELAGREWAHRFEVLGAERLGPEEPVLEEDEFGYLWAVEEVWRTGEGLYLYARAERRPGRPERRRVLLGRDPAELVRSLRACLGLTPGRVEVLGRAGIEVGLEPDDEVEGDDFFPPS